MPTYQFLCDQCGMRFEERMSVVEHAQNRPDCPKCHSAESVRAELSTFVAMTDKKT
jgi:putative FmdB family regulatory protein